MKSNSVGVVTPEKITFDVQLKLESGKVLPSFELMVETYGELNANKSNAVLICHALSGHHHVAGWHGEEGKDEGWWDNMIGPGKPIDTNKFFVIGLNNLGGCHGSTGPKSINPETGKPWGKDFPVVTVKDWVRSQKLLQEKFGIEKWAAVVGGSLGGMQAMQWSIDFPDRIANAVVIASAPKLSAQNIAFNDVARQAILTDPNFMDGDYLEKNTIPKNGLKIARMMGHITYLAEDGLAHKFGREKKIDGTAYNYDTEFQVESYLRYQGDKFAGFFDAHTYLLMTKVLDYFDPAQEYGDDLDKAMANVKCDYLVVSFTSDWRFSSERSVEIVKSLIHNKKNVTYLDVESTFGHDAFLMEDKDYHDAMRAYMNRIHASL